MGDVTLRVIEHLEQTQYIADFRSLKVTGRRVATNGNTGQTENLNIIVGLLGQGAHQSFAEPVLVLDYLGAALAAEYGVGLAGH